ncbi:MAG: ThiF family adenylyltransferase [Clostridia bacterium]|nr:ThiF family adenylyltransferase [Clostridia bacterium]
MSYIERMIPIHNLDNGYNARFRGTEWADKIQNKYDIILIGLGGIGSNTTYTVGRLKPKKITLIDPDRINNVNLSGQMYTVNDLGEEKVNKCKQLLVKYCDYTGFTIAAKHDHFNKSHIYNFMRYDQSLTHVCITGLDNMQARQNVFIAFNEAIKDTSIEGRIILIDSRMTIDKCQVITLDTYNPNFDFHLKRYKNQMLFNDSEAESDVCSAKQTTYMGTMIASLIANTLVNTAQPASNTVPFLLEYDANTFNLKKEYE